MVYKGKCFDKILLQKCILNISSCFDKPLKMKIIVMNALRYRMTQMGPKWVILKLRKIYNAHFRVSCSNISGYFFIKLSAIFLPNRNQTSDCSFKTLFVTFPAVPLILSK